MPDRVLLTGISGFLAGHLALKLLEVGYVVRGSVRKLDRAGKVRDTLARQGADVGRLEFVELDLTRDEGWREAAEGCRYLQHTASPFVIQMPRDRMELVGPAIAGTERAINAALAANVERVVLTSSMAAIAYGHDKDRTAPFTSSDWTNLESRTVNAYIESKTRAERRAWELMRSAGREKDLAAVNPSAILGPLLDEDPGTSAALLVRLYDGSTPAAPRIPLTIVDVRDVAELHVRAMEAPEAGGRRFPIGDRTMFLGEIADAARAASDPERAKKITRWTMPDWLVRIYGLFDADVRGNLGELGILKRLDSREAVALLGHPLIPAREAIGASVRSLVAHKLI